MSFHNCFVFVYRSGQMGLWEDHVAASYTSSGRASWRRTSSIYTWLWKVGRHLRPNRTPRWSKICKFTFFSLCNLKVPWKDGSTRTLREPATGVFLIFSCFQWFFLVPACSAPHQRLGRAQIVHEASDVGRWRCTIHLQGLGIFR